MTPASKPETLEARVSKAICYRDNPDGCGCESAAECKSDGTDIFGEYARAAIAVVVEEAAKVAHPGNNPDWDVYTARMIQGAIRALAKPGGQS